jgi:hypothetical protein
MSIISYPGERVLQLQHIPEQWNCYFLFTGEKGNLFRNVDGVRTSKMSPGLHKDL